MIDEARAEFEVYLDNEGLVRKRAKSQFLKFQAETMAGRERKGSRKGPAKGGRSGKAGSRGVQKQRR